jgi:diguanylate cyclase (GGDEF)-like protein
MNLYSVKSLGKADLYQIVFAVKRQNDIASGKGVDQIMLQHIEQNLMSEVADAENVTGPITQKYVKSLHERIRLLEAVIDNFPGGISLFDNELRLVLCNEQQKRLLEYPDDLFASGYPTLEQIYRLNAVRGEYGPGDVEEHVAMRMTLANERRAHVFERTRPNGTVLEIRGAPIEGGGFVTTYLDVTIQRSAQAQVAHLALHDALTNLANRTLLQDRMQMALTRTLRGDIAALLYLDLDRFKHVNDNFGHSVGDELLKAVADRLVKGTRPTDTVARIGGDEFVVLQVGIRGPQESATLAHRLVNSISTPFYIAGHMISIGTSIGIALASGTIRNWEKLLSHADDALYRSKAAGRGTFQFAESSMPVAGEGSVVD